jgi:hypothetical protein
VAEAGAGLLACGCGEVGCWPLEARIITGAGTVTWTGFAQPTAGRVTTRVSEISYSTARPTNTPLRDG